MEEKRGGARRKDLKTSVIYGKHSFQFLSATTVGRFCCLPFARSFLSGPVCFRLLRSDFMMRWINERLKNGTVGRKWNRDCSVFWTWQPNFHLFCPISGAFLIFIVTLTHHPHRKGVYYFVRIIIFQSFVIMPSLPILPATRQGTAKKGSASLPVCWRPKNYVSCFT